jgi:hypothetical protein
VPPGNEPGPVKADAGARDALAACFDRLNAEGYHQRLAYQPASRFWPLQLVETGVVLVVSGLLGCFCFWRIRRVS